MTDPVTTSTADDTASALSAELTLDDLYWHSDLPVPTIAARFGLPHVSLHRRVTPLDAGVACYLCRHPLAYTSRTARANGWWLTCARCGATRRNPNQVERPSQGRPALVGGTILLRMTDRVGVPIEACVETLARAGVAWDEQSLVVLEHPASDGGDALSHLLELEPGTLVVPSLCDLAATQTERLQALFLLTRMRWRVLAAHDTPGRAERPRPMYVDDLDAPIDDDDPWSPTWSEHLVDLTNRNERFGGGRGWPR